MSYDLQAFEDEDDIQDVIRSFMEREKFGSILEEDYLDRVRFEALQKHQFILVDDLRAAIERLNSRLLDGSYAGSKDDIVDCILTDFIARFDLASGNVDVHDLIFGQHRRVVTLKRADGEVEDQVLYRVVDTDYETDCRNNEVTVIKEKVICLRPGSDRYEKPDFAIYLNGLPFIAMEVKNPTRTSPMVEALLDYRNKPTYHRFLACICTDGSNAGLVANPNAVTVDFWRNYGRHRREGREENGLFDMLEELVFNAKNMVFYFQYGLFQLTHGAAPALGTLRVHQYFVTKAAVGRIEQFEYTGELFREVVKQPPRSGKTIAIRSTINVITSRFPGAYDKIFVQVPDLTIMDQFYRDFSRFKFANGFRVKKIDGRWDDESASDSRVSYETAVREGGKAIYIMNMQKISEEMRDLRNPDASVLIFIDEVHTHQSGINATVRELNFPKASYITFTATTRKHIKGDRTVDQTLIDYSTSNSYLDELFNEDAKNLEMVVPVVYERARYNIVFGEDDAQQLSDYSDITLRRMVREDYEFESFREEVAGKVDHFVRDLIDIADDRKADADEIASKALKYRERLIEERITRYKDELKIDFSRQQREKHIPGIVSFVVKDIHTKVDEEYSTDNIDTGVKTRNFEPKIFLQVEDTAMANLFAQHISEISGGTNVIGGLKFGMDYSDGMSFGDREETIAQSFNRITYGSTIKDDFDSQQPGSTNVLIIVGKYLMGYDNKQLIAVYCYSTIKEPARIFQLYTRPATKYPGKKFGTFVDMCFVDTNYETYCKAMDWYEGGRETTVLYLQDEQLETRRQVLWKLIDKLAFVLGVGRDGLISSKGNERNLFTRLDESGKNAAMSLCKDIMQAVRNLLSRKYYGEFLEYVLAINKGLFGLVNHLKASKQEVVFTSKDIRRLLTGFLDVLNINLDDIMSIELVGDKMVRVRPENANSQTVISRHVHEADALLRSSKEYMSGDMFGRLRRMAEDIKAANVWDDDTEERARDLVQQSKKAVDAIDDTIRREFDGRPEWYVCFMIMRNFLAVRDVEIEYHVDAFRNFTSDYSTMIRESVRSNMRDGQLTISEAPVNNALTNLTKALGTLSRTTGPEADLFKGIYRALCTKLARVGAEEMIRALLSGVYTKANEFQKHSAGDIRDEAYIQAA